MELATLRTLNNALCATLPTWSYRTKEGMAILRFTKDLDETATGFLYVKVDGVFSVKTFNYYPTALPNPISVGLVLEHYLKTLNTETDLKVEFITWSEDVSFIKVTNDAHFLTVGSSIIGSVKIGVGNSLSNRSIQSDFESSFGRLSAIAFLTGGYRNPPLPKKPLSAVRVKRVYLEVAADRPGVYLTESFGRELAKCNALDESLGYDAVIIEFPLQTRIITVEFLKGLLLEVYCQSGSKDHFYNRYRLVGALNLAAYLTQFDTIASEIKKKRKERCLF